jgi:hypothetical protein
MTLKNSYLRKAQNEAQALKFFKKKRIVDKFIQTKNNQLREISIDIK